MKNDVDLAILGHIRGCVGEMRQLETGFMDPYTRSMKWNTR